MLQSKRRRSPIIVLNSHGVLQFHPNYFLLNFAIQKESHKEDNPMENSKDKAVSTIEHRNAPPTSKATELGNKVGGFLGNALRATKEFTSGVVKGSSISRESVTQTRAGALGGQIGGYLKKAVKSGKEFTEAAVHGISPGSKVNWRKVGICSGVGLLLMVTLIILLPKRSATPGAGGGNVGGNQQHDQYSGKSRHELIRMIDSELRRKMDVATENLWQDCKHEIATDDLFSARFLVKAILSRESSPTMVGPFKALYEELGGDPPATQPAATQNVR